MGTREELKYILTRIAVAVVFVLLVLILDALSGRFGLVYWIPGG